MVCYVQAPGLFISWEIQGFGWKEQGMNVAALAFSLSLSLSLSQVTLVKARAASRAHPSEK